MFLYFLFSEEKDRINLSEIIQNHFIHLHLYPFSVFDITGHIFIHD